MNTKYIVDNQQGFKNKPEENSLVVYCLKLHVSTAGSMGSIPAWRSKIPHVLRFTLSLKKKKWRERCDLLNVTFISFPVSQNWESYYNEVSW